MEDRFSVEHDKGKFVEKRRRTTGLRFDYGSRVTEGRMVRYE
jgi:hypothetical protein